MITYNQKKEGSKIHSSTTVFNEPRCPCLPEPLDTAQTSENVQFTNCLLDPHKRQRRARALLPHTHKADFTTCVPCLTHSHRVQQKGNIFIALQAYTHSENTSFLSVQYSQKHELPNTVYCLSL